MDFVLQLYGLLTNLRQVPAYFSSFILDLQQLVLKYAKQIDQKVIQKNFKFILEDKADLKHNI